MQMSGGSQVKASRVLGITRGSLRKKLRHHGFLRRPGRCPTTLRRSPHRRTLVTAAHDDSVSEPQRLTRLYMLALGAVAILSLAGQAVFKVAGEATGDSTVINVAGRQRMLSQRIAKTALEIQATEDELARQAATTDLAQDLALWRRCHLGLQRGDAALGLPGKNSPAVGRMFAELEPSFVAIQAAGEALLQPGAATADSHTAVATILRHERVFLAGMDRIVNQYDRRSPRSRGPLTDRRADSLGPDAAGAAIGRVAHLSAGGAADSDRRPPVARHARSARRRQGSRRSGERRKKPLPGDHQPRIANAAARGPRVVGTCPARICLRLDPRATGHD